MNCADYEVLISALADNELSGTAKAEVEEHINHCDSCRRLYTEMVQLQHDIASILAKEPADMPDIKWAIDKPKAKFVWAWATAAIVLIAIGFGIFYMPREYINTPENYVKRTESRSVITQKPNISAQNTLSEHARSKPQRLKKQQKQVYICKVSHTPVSPIRPQEIKTVAVTTNSVPAEIAADKTEAAVAYTDATPNANFNSITAAMPTTHGIGSRQQIITDKEIIEDNGRRILRVCYKTISIDSPLTNKPQGE